jgi:hypothetical protein
MNETAANPVFVALLFILRCLVPLAILFGISYLLRRFGPEEANDQDEEPQQSDKES